MGYSGLKAIGTVVSVLNNSDFNPDELPRELVRLSILITGYQDNAGDTQRLIQKVRDIASCTHLLHLRHLHLRLEGRLSFPPVCKKVILGYAISMKLQTLSLFQSVQKAASWMKFNERGISALGENNYLYQRKLAQIMILEKRQAIRRLPSTLKEYLL